MTTRAIFDEAPTAFTRKTNQEEMMSYDMELLTPMLGGGVKSWVPDYQNPIRSQSIKGHLRFWWRTMQHCDDAATLRKREEVLWGSTSNASTVRLAVLGATVSEKKIVVVRDQKKLVKDKDLPSYVIFPLQGQKEDNEFTVITGLKFQLILHCRPEDRDAVENSVRLWVLFGGIGARTKRGCGSILCQQIMEFFSTSATIKQHILKFQKEGGPEFTEAPFPQLQNCRLAWQVKQGNGDPKAAWKNFLDRYELFRQGENFARNQGKIRNRPGRTIWPEADAIRHLTGKTKGKHTPERLAADNWFPRGAYGLPIQTEFPNEPSDPQGKFMLAPKDDGCDRWPSPMILKIIKLINGDILQTCLILNHTLPEKLMLTGPTIDHTLSPTEMPLCFKGKNMPTNAPLPSNTSPYDAIIKFFKLREV